MTRKTVTIVLVLLALTAVTAFADTGPGVILGDPTGISLLFSERVALGELVPGIQLLPATGVDVDTGIGIRFHLQEQTIPARH